MKNRRANGDRRLLEKVPTVDARRIFQRPEQLSGSSLFTSNRVIFRARGFPGVVRYTGGVTSPLGILMGEKFVCFEIGVIRKFCVFFF